MLHFIVRVEKIYYFSKMERKVIYLFCICNFLELDQLTRR